MVRREILQTNAPTPALIPRQLHLHLHLPLGANSIPVATKQNCAHERVNHVAVEEAQEAPDVVIGMFSINDTSAVVLFDSGASYSFMSTTYVENHNLPLALLKYQMIVSSLRGDIPARQLCPKLNLKRRGGVTLSSTYCLGIKGH
jgi:hypothetical protein